jgi:hypothetical protein
MSMLTALKSSIKKLPIIHKIVSERDQLRAERDQLYAERDQLSSELIELRRTLRFVPPGHFYSPIPSLDEVKRDESQIFGNVHQNIPSIELHESEQLKLLEEFTHYYEEIPFQPSKVEGLRYYFENPLYSYSDSILLHCMIRFLNPKRIIEVGSGFSSCVILDTNELFFDSSIMTTFIDPYPDLLMSLIKEKDKNNIKIISSRLQDVELREIEVLEERDILFIDSTHVSKVNSDVNHIFFIILPHLSAGVHIHFHDIFYPFEYPKDWVYEGRAWNEAYMLRTFLQYNSEFRIVLMNTFMQYFHEQFFREKMPLCLKNPGGSIWIRKGKECIG